jgi:hypothetical protein
VVIDVYEHAFYIDYQNKKADYVEKFLKFMDWRGRPPVSLGPEAVGLTAAPARPRGRSPGWQTAPHP